MMEMNILWMLSLITNKKKAISNGDELKKNTDARQTISVKSINLKIYNIIPVVNYRSWRR